MPCCCRKDVCTGVCATGDYRLLALYCMLRVRLPWCKSCDKLQHHLLHCHGATPLLLRLVITLFQCTREVGLRLDAAWCMQACQLPAASCTHCLPQECAYHGYFEAALVFSASCIYGIAWHPTTCLFFSEGGNRFVQCGMTLYVWQDFGSRELQLS